MESASMQAYLAANRFFRGLAPEYLEFLVQRVNLRQLDNDAVLFRHGDRASHFYLVTRGHITVEVAAIEGPALELQSLGEDSVLGWSWMIPPYQWSFQARTTEPTEVLEFDGAEILKRCETDPRLGYELLKRFSGLMSDRLHFARRRMMDEWKAPGFA